MGLEGLLGDHVTISKARSVPVVGEPLANVLGGGVEVGTLTIGRWYVAHVLLLPMALAGLVLAHLYLVRRHGISGPLAPAAGERKPFYPYHALKDTIAIAAVFAVLVTLAITIPLPSGTWRIHRTLRTCCARSGTF